MKNQSARIKALNKDRDFLSRAYEKLDNIFGLEPKIDPSADPQGLVDGGLSSGIGINPLKAAGMAGHAYDSLVTAPTRAAIKAGETGENPLMAAASQFSEDPATAPDFGMVGNFVADPLLIAGVGAKGMKYAKQMGEFGGALGREAMHASTSGKNFKEALDAAVAARPQIKEFISDYPVDEMEKFRNFLSADGKSGYSIKPDGDLINVFSEAKGRGQEIMRDAVAARPKTLDAYDVGGKLPDLYSRYGFNELRREANWTPGGPDVVFMKRGIVERPQDLDNRALKAALRLKALSASGAVDDRLGE